MQAPVILLTLMLFSSNAFGNCVTNERGRACVQQWIGCCWRI